MLLKVLARLAPTVPMTTMAAAAIRSYSIAVTRRWVFDQAENSRVFEAIVSSEGCSDTKLPAKFVINADEI